ncbi:mechanosensitive ion channel domain-containing protein [Aureimonas pseudogalii]|uniref:Small conductance mechanosensitive channel n=1 Tax=Aureimonas pseudogalii TaxID=1744844 RepID=A0A7W6H4U3_9HYPH|nr:mechanosensitive ion channel domain-containing protein [Aureimonas pseudogalii]MBB3998299.1 small conductance mechanosensitive channel [Aureimonas pseudogalii]
MLRHAGVRTIFLLVAAIFFALPAARAQIPGLPSLTGTSASSPAKTETQTTAEGASLDDLIRILETEATRNRLIESLKAAAYQPGAQATAAAQTAAPGVDDLVESVPEHLAAYTRSGVEVLQMTAQEALDLARQGLNFLSGARAIDLPRVWQAVQPVTIVALAVFVALAALGFLDRRIGRWLNARANPRAPLKRLLLVCLATLADVASIIVSTGAGHLTALAVYGGPPNLNQALFLNAFVLTELVKIGLSAFAMPHDPALRMTPFSDGQARYWYRRLALVITLLGYTFLFVAPVVQTNSSIAAGNAVRFITVAIAFAAMEGLILANRVRVGRRLQKSYRGGSRTIQARFYLFLGTIWWVLAGAFVFALFALWLSSPRNGFQFMLTASFKSVAAMAIGGLVASVLKKVVTRGVRVSSGTKDRFPLIERRLNSFIPKVLFVIRTLVVLIVVGVILDAWGLLEFDGWLQTEVGQRFTRSLVGALFILVVAFGIYLTVSSWVEYRLNPNYGSVPTARERTLLSLFRNAFTIALGVIVLMLVLSQLGIDIAPLLAGAGVVGLAVGFGAQKLVQDIITGAFIQIENALNEGDVVQLGAVSGVVEKLTIRSVSLRALDGTYYLIPFSSVDQVANMTKDFSNFVADVAVAYREDVEEVKAAMQEAFDEVRASEQGINIIADFEMLGVELLGDYAVTVRARIRTLPGKQWPIGRLYKQSIKSILDRRGIEIPFPQTTVWFGEGKNHNAPPLHLAGLVSANAAIQGGSDGSPAAAKPPLRTPERNPDGTLIPPAGRDQLRHDGEGDADEDGEGRS